MKRIPLLQKLSRNAPLYIAVLIFVIVGAVLLLVSHAATLVVSVEPESGTVSNPAVAINDSTASNGGAVKFGATVQSGSCVVTAKLVNPCRPWLGAYGKGYPQKPAGLKSQVLYHEQRTGRQGDIVRGDYHVDDQTSFSADELYFINRPNTTLLIDWKVDKTNWAAASGGNATINARIDQMADTMKAVAPHKVMLVVYHEPENDVTSDSNCPSINFKGTAGTPTDYRNMWRNVENRFRAKGVDNVVYVFDVEGYKPFNCLVNDLYPGNDLVDWVMFDIYSHGGQTTYQSAVGPFYQWLTANSNAQHDYLSKPWGSGEYGIHGVNQATAYAFYDALKQNVDNNTFPNIKAYIIFDSDAGSGGQPTVNGEGRIEYDATGTLDPVEQQHYNGFAQDPRLTDIFYTH
jgi:hypothetical protein